jgi:DNA-directed RNA polymerase specialized sigma24 family protein
MTTLEIADALSINSNTVNARLRLARKRFEREMVRRMER